MKTKKSKANTDLEETKDDKQHLKADKATLDLPEVKDIPGQEHIHVPPAGEMADTTISSDDEEGKGVLDEEQDELLGPGTNVSEEEKKALRDAAEKELTVDEQNLEMSMLEQRDEDGELLNEQVDVSGSDLDVPGSEDDDDNEEIGEEDEENNSYSLGSEQEDENLSRQ